MPYHLQQFSVICKYFCLFQKCEKQINILIDAHWKILWLYCHCGGAFLLLRGLLSLALVPYNFLFEVTQFYSKLFLKVWIEHQQYILVSDTRFDKWYQKIQPHCVVCIFNAGILYLFNAPFVVSTPHIKLAPNGSISSLWCCKNRREGNFSASSYVEIVPHPLKWPIIRLIICQPFKTYPEIGNGNFNITHSHFID